MAKKDETGNTDTNVPVADAPAPVEDGPSATTAPDNTEQKNAPAAGDATVPTE